jgi:hypothetical protein
MAEQVVTDFVINLTQYDAQIAKATEGMAGFDKEVTDVNKANKELSGAAGSAAGKVKELGVVSDKAGKGLSGVKKEAGGLKEAFSAVGQELNSTFPIFGKVGNAAKLLGRAFTVALGPVGIAIAAVVAAIGLLTKVFFGTERGSETLDRALSILTTVFDRLLGVAQKVTFALVDTFKNPKQAVADLWEAIKTNIVNRITALADQFKFLGEIIAGVFTLDTDRITAGVSGFGEATVQALTGVDDLAGKVADGFNKIKKEVVDAGKAGLQIEKLKEQLEDLALVQATRGGELTRIIAEQMDLARDGTKTDEARAAAAQAAIAAQNELSGLAAKQNKLEVQRLALQQKQSDTSIEGQIELANLKAQGDQIEADRINANKRALAIVRGIEAENSAAAIAEAEKRAEAEAQAAEEAKALREKQAAETIELQGQVNDNLDRLREERELSQLSATDRAIEEARNAAAKEVEVTGELYDRLEELAGENAEKIAEIRELEAQSIALTEQQLAEQIAAIRTKGSEDETERLKAEQEQRIGILTAASDQLNGVIEQGAAGQIATAEQAGKALVGIALDLLEKQALLSIASATTQSLASPQSVATGGTLGLAQAAILTALIKAALAGVRGALAGSFYDGGIVGQDGDRKSVV